jgi:hypothetical protein
MKRNLIISPVAMQPLFFQLSLIAGIVLFSYPWQSVKGQVDRYSGLRPYELDWAGRYEDDHIPLIDFEKAEKWRVDATDGSASISRSNEEIIWGDYCYKLSYNANSTDADFMIYPPEAVKIPETFTAINMWVFGNYRIWNDSKRERPISKLSIILESNNGETFEIPFSRNLDHGRWYLLHIRLNKVQREAFADGGFLKGFKLSNCLSNVDEAIYFDNLSFFEEDFTTPLEYDILPRPGVDLAPGQDLGVHTGEKRLPFPTREETILPENVSKDYATDVYCKGDTYILRYSGDDGELEYRYRPKKGDLSDITAQWMDGDSEELRPMDNGGIKMKTDDEVDSLITERFGNFRPNRETARDPENFKLIDCIISGNTVVTRWKVGYDKQSTEVEYTFRIWQKSLVIDVKSLGGEVGKVSLGKVSNAVNPELIEVPYLVGRPKVLKTGPEHNPLFMTSLVDYYRTGSSGLYFSGYEKGAIYCNGGTYYVPKTNGKRNDCYERLFLTLSPRFEETLPTIPNPRALSREDAADHLVCYYAVYDRDEDYQYWKNAARYGINKVVMLDWEVCWRDDAESFTFRSSAAPGKGGDEDLMQYVQKVQDLGLRYALYNNFVDHAPVNALWDEDVIVRLPNGGWQQAWFRTYTAKPAKAVKLSRLVSKSAKRKFNPTAGGPDVHTAVSPYSRVDYDERMPGAGTMMTQFYSYGQLLLEQQEIWEGPTYSECHSGYYYSGLTTGSGACDGSRFDNRYWLVDFYLRKMQPISAHWSLGMGERNDEGADRYFARTIAYGMPGGYLGGWRQPFDLYSIRGYFLIQQLQSYYGKALIKSIRYANKKGELLEVSAAIAEGAHRRMQLKLVYDNGLEIWVNGSKEENWKTPFAELPPSGYYAKLPDRELEVFSALKDGKRGDYVHSPAYDFMDGRGQWIETPQGGTDGQLIVLKKNDGSLEVIPYGAEKFAIALNKEPESLVALDEDYNEIGQAKWKFVGGMYYIQPVEGAFSYMIKK